MHEEPTRDELLEVAADLRKRIAEMEAKEARSAFSEEAFRQSEERLHQVITNAPIVLWALDRDGVFTLSVGKGLEAMGLRPGEVVGSSLFEVYADHPQILEDNRRALLGESLGSTVEVGGLVFACQLSPLRGPDGEVIGAIGVATDITESRKIEEALREREAALEQQTRQQEGLLRISRVVQALSGPADLEAVVKVCSDQLKRLGMTIDGLAIQRLIDEEERRFESYEVQPSGRINRMDVTLSNLFPVWESGKSLYRPDLEADLGGLTPAAWERICDRYGVRIRCILNVPHSMGLVSLLSSEANAFSDTDIAFVEQVGQMLSLGISRVGDLERLEARTDALTESEERFRKVFEEGPLGMVLVSPDLQLMAANEAFCRMVGYTEPELIERALAELTHLEDAAGDAERMRELMAGEIPVYETEKRYVNGDGSTLWADQVASTVRDRDDRIAYGLVIVQDITDRRRTEQELVRLERLRALGELAAGVSHNLNNMLTGILGPAQLVKHLTDDPMVLREADIIINSSKRAADLVHRLNLSVRGKDDGEVSAVSVNELVESVIDETRPRWKDEPESRGVHIDVATDLRDVPPVRGTPSKLHDVLVNVLFNAVDAMPEGGTVTLSTRPDGAFVEVGVRDTGVGMDEETRRRVFEPFFTTKMDVGTGLGLSTVYGTITRSGGTAQVESTPGEGTAFSFRLPVWDDAPPEC